MKKALFVISILLTAVLMLCGCSDEVETVEGGWLSADGSTLVLTEESFQLTDAFGKDVLGCGSVPYEWADDCFYLTIDGVQVKVFDVDLTGDTLTLTYTDEIQSDMGMEYGEKIVLTREDDSDSSASLDY